MFRRTKTTQREYLYEDIEQIRRYFPGAELAETLETPFDLSRPGLVTWDVRADSCRPEAVPVPAVVPAVRHLSSFSAHFAHFTSTLLP